MKIKTKKMKAGICRGNLMSVVIQKYDLTHERNENIFIEFSFTENKIGRFFSTNKEFLWKFQTVIILQ